jgi:hypothetical protein
MKANVGMTDRVVRMYLGVITASLLIYFNSSWALIGIPVFVSGIVGVCPLYSIMGISTVKKPEQIVV